MPNDGNFIGSSAALGARVAELAGRLEELKFAYEQYFLGMEKREPAQLNQLVVGMMRSLDQIRINNTALRYRYQGLVARFNTYRNYWQRTLRAIEAGTYHRDVARVRRKLAGQGIEMRKLSMPRSAAEVERAIREAVEQSERKSASAIRGRSADDLRKDIATPPPAAPAASDSARVSSDLDAALDDVFDSLMSGPSPKPEAPTAPAQPPPPPADKARRASTQSKQPARAAARKSEPLPAGFSREQMDSLYRRFVKAKKMCGEDPSSVRYDSLVRSISRQLPKIRGGDSSKEVNFQVVIRNGRAILKAKR